MPNKKKKKYNSRFPPTRIKRIMQTDEDVGKVAAAVPVIISRALELFVESLIRNASQITRARNAKTLTTSHLKQCILAENKFDFLKDLVASVPDVQGDDDSSNPLPSGDPAAAAAAVAAPKLSTLNKFKRGSKTRKLSRTIAGPSQHDDDDDEDDNVDDDDDDDDDESDEDDDEDDDDEDGSEDSCAASRTARLGSVASTKIKVHQLPCSNHVSNLSSSSSSAAAAVAAATAFPPPPPNGTSRTPIDHQFGIVGSAGRGPHQLDEDYDS